MKTKRRRLAALQFAKKEENCITFSKNMLVDSFIKEVIDEDVDGNEVGRHRKEILVERELWFIDSYRFTLASLDDLINV